MTKNTKTKIITGTVITALGVGIGYTLYGLRKARNAKIEKEISKDLNQLADDYVENHSGYAERNYIELGFEEKGGKRR